MKLFPFPLLKRKEDLEKPKYKERIFLADLISPSSIVVSSKSLIINQRLAKTYFVFSYPRYLMPGWLIPIIELEIPFDLSLHIHPEDTGKYLRRFTRKLTEVQASILEREEKLMVRDPELEAAARDIETLRDKLVAGQEKMFQVGLYLTVYANSEEELKNIETVLRSILEIKMVYLKPALFQQEEAFHSTTPQCLDKLQLYQPLNTEPLSTFFPFISFDLTSNEGILYGINQHNNSLILFDRFNLPNANMVIFGTTGSGKSYFEKTEILRYLMWGVDCIIIDPENEYERLAHAVGGTFFDLSLSSPHHLNPFDLPIPREDETAEEVIRSNVIHLVELLRLMAGGLTPEEDALCDRALTETYAVKDITPTSDPKTWKEKVPLMEDFLDVLEGMEGSEQLVRKLKKFTEGSYANFFNQYSNVSLDKNLIVFGIRDMEEDLRPLAMFIVMKYIWAKIREELKKRIMVVDEAWWLMKNEDSASFLFGIVKRARKYWLGVTTITQDVGDFMKSVYGQPIITNSALAVLFKQSPATIDIVQRTFNLTNEEKNLLLEAEVGEGLFFAGQKHVAMKVVASYIEDQIITTSPKELLKLKEAKKI